MLHDFIIATDFSKASFALVECLKGLKAYGAKHALLLQCLSMQQLGSVAFSYSTDYLESILEQQKKILEKQGFDVETRVVPENPKREINRIAFEDNYSFVVVGSRGHSLAQEIVLGGVANDVIHSARKPVLVVRLEHDPDSGAEYARAVRCDFTGHILFPTDFSENAEQAFLFLEEIVKGGIQHVTLMHVQDQTKIERHLDSQLEKFNEIDRGRLESMKEVLRKHADTEVTVELCYGKPFSEINRFAREQEVNMVLMGSQGRGYVSELFLGSVSHNVARYAPASVFLVPAARATD